MADARELRMFRPLTENPPLRLATVFVFYIFQGVPMGMFYFGVPSYLAARGASAAEIAGVVSAFALPWTLKLVNGFFMDRYAFLPMGRRRAWIIGSQFVMVMGFLAGAALNPVASDIALLAALAFAISLATTFQDVAIDSLVVDIMDEDDRAKAGGIMFGAQTLGIAGGTAASGWLLERYGASAAFGAGALLMAGGVAFALLLLERPGERRLPWGAGAAHPHNLSIKLDAWGPLLKQSVRAIFAPASLLIIPFLLARGLPNGANDVFNPVLAAEHLGWSTAQFTGAASIAQLAAGALGLTVGGWLTAHLGSRTMMTILFAVLAAQHSFVGALRPEWDQPWMGYQIIWATECLTVMVAVAMIPLAMQVCSPAVAATQFTIYMAVANFGRPIGAWIAALTLEGDARNLHYAVASIMAAAALGTLLLARRPATGGPGKLVPVGAATEN